MPPIVCSSHTISGVMPGGPIASRHGFADRVRACAEAGFDGMCLHFRDYAEQVSAGMSDADLRAVLDFHGMTENSVEFLRDWFRPEGEANVVLALDAAEAFGAKFLSIGGDLDRPGLPVAAMIPAFAALCRRAAERGLGVALEIVAWGNVRDPATAMELVTAGGPNAGLVIDAWHIFRGGVSLESLQTLDPRRISCVQLSDAGPAGPGPLSHDTMRRRFCGEGDLELGAFLDALARIGVAAPLAVEVIAPEVAGMALDEVARRAYATTLRTVMASELMVRS